MSDAPEDPRERFEELFIADLLFGLSDEERAEFDSLSATQGRDDLKPFADLIALLDIARSASDGARLPHALRERIRSDATRELQDATSATTVAQPSSRPLSPLPWSLAAICLLIAVIVVATTWPFERPGEPSQNPYQMRDDFLANAHDLIRIDWSDGPTPIAGAQGDVAWSLSEQTGYLRFEGLPVNDPLVEQYQLWIFDRNQDEKTPVDGGVFDVTSTGETVVPIQASLRVREPYLFAITIEKPGGVVVSDRSRLPLLAAVPQ